MVLSFSEICFTFFMTHQMVIKIWEKYIGYPNWLGRCDLTFGVVFIICLLFSLSVYKFIEVPISRGINSIFNKQLRNITNA